jgi:CxxC motif-containing protein (DUF1111 family)
MSALIRNFVLRVTCAMVFLSGALTLTAQTDPGPRGGAAGAGAKFPTLNSNETMLFNQAQQRFKEVDSVSGTISGESGSGLGPTFNGNSCAMCHAQPAVGGSSPGLISKQNPIPNPQVALATLDKAGNFVPSFITANGPVREARFVSDGGVHDLFTIEGRTDAPGCGLEQPDFAANLENHNVIFRIPTALFGLGLVENTPDLTLQANLAANAQAKSTLGIAGRFNTSGNDGTITRFGWKAQNKSLLMFAGEAYNVEQGVANELFPNERSAVAGCVFNPGPEDATNILDPTTGLTVGTASDMSSDIVNFAIFARLLAPPAPAMTATPSASVSGQNGMSLFASVGCALCHSPSLTTAASIYTGMSGVTYHPFSDFALHHMGSGLADGISQGIAEGDEFRTAPLWGLGQRLFFLHDGRTSDLLQVIQAHSSTGSEANGVVSKFNALTQQQKQDILNFLRSL